MNILPFGDRALLIQFDQDISGETFEKVMKVNEGVKTIDGVEYTIPAYNSITVSFSPEKLSYDSLKNKIQNIQPDKVPHGISRLIKLPVCYEHTFAPDIEEVADQLGKTTNWVVEKHLATTFTVFMLGFLPGFAYLGKYPASVKRKPSPRKSVPENSVGLAGWQTGIYPTSSPGGWQIIGRTPIPVFDPKLEDPFLFQPGDRIEFYNVSHAKYQKLKAAYSNNELGRNQLFANHE